MLNASLEKWQRSHREASASLVDVARQARVSPTTVSRFFNQPDLVRPRTRARIERAVAELGYLPNAAARALASKRSRMVGVVVPTLDHALFAKALNSLEGRFAAAGYTLVVAASGFDRERERRQVESLLTHRIDALVLVGAARDPAVYALLRGQGLPYVTTWVVDQDEGHPGVGIDNRAAGRRIADHLLDLGHRDFGVISAETAENDRARARLAGVRAALEARGVALARERVIERPLDLLEGGYAFRHLMGLSPAPSAVICGADLFAVGAVFESPRLGLRVPDDVSVTGFDDIDLASLVDPPLTTLRVPVREIGERAADYLLKRLRGEAVPDSTLLEVELLLRGSTAAPKAKENSR
ncbi:MAG: LacI family DNA-binding transcriptional regulator [Kiloniellales bacterium]|nr:LacI family DNA-binding transcriptional regulator [Kiloniellales bacterium]